MSLPHQSADVYQEKTDLITNRIAGLLSLLDYAHLHPHSRHWIGTIRTILAREGPDV